MQSNVTERIMLWMVEAIKEMPRAIISICPIIVFPLAPWPTELCKCGYIYSPESIVQKYLNPWDVLSWGYYILGGMSSADVDILDVFSFFSVAPSRAFPGVQDLFGHFTWSRVLSMGQWVWKWSYIWTLFSQMHRFDWDNFQRSLCTWGGIMRIRVVQ